MTIIKGFWSYVHKDDKAEGGRIIKLAKDIVDQYELLTGEDISLFLDKDDIAWGENWREAIDSNLATVAFFIPVMSPRYFMSAECRRELQTFARLATELGIKELILPLYYIDVPEINKDKPTDELVNLVNSFQREDWRDLRFYETTSEGYRRAVSKIASHLVEANKRAEEAFSNIVTLEDQERPMEASLDESPGIIDQLATAEETIKKWPETLNNMTQDIQLIGSIMNEGTENIQRANSQGQGFSARLVITRQLSQKLVDPIERIWIGSNQSASQVHDVDAGYRIIISRATQEIQEKPESKQYFCTFFAAIRSMNTSAKFAIENIKKMINAIEPLEKMSRDMRPILRRLRQGLTIMIESIEVSGEWVALIDGTGIVCEDLSINPTS